MNKHIGRMAVVLAAIMALALSLVSCNGGEWGGDWWEGGGGGGDTPTPGGSGWAAVSAGAQHALAIRADGSLWAWGTGPFGELGLGANQLDRGKTTPTRVGTDSWKAVSAGASYSLAIRTDGSLWAWGWNEEGWLGLGDSGDGTDRYTPTRVGTENNWAAVSTNYLHSLALKTDGSLWAWGNNDCGQLGLGTSDNNAHPTPTRVGADSWKAVSVGASHSLAIKTDGSLWAWGYNGDGRLGIGDYDYTARSVPTRVGADTNWAAVSAGEVHTLALKTDGSLWAWGLGGLLGFGTWDVNAHPTPARVGTDSWKAVSAGRAHSLAIKTDGSLWAWGVNRAGQLGLGTSDDNAHPTPARVGTDNNWNSLSRLAANVPLEVIVDQSHSFAIRTDGSLWAWGANMFWQLGLGDNNNRNVPTRVP